MELFIKKTIGKNVYTFVVQGKNLYESVMASQKLSFGDIQTCGLCNSDNLILNARNAQDQYEYVEVKCLACKGQLVFGQPKKDKNTYYLRKDKVTKKYAWKEYVPTPDENINE